MNEKINLLDYTTNAGCSCKIAPQILQKIIQLEEKALDVNLLIGNSTSDDAAVYAINDTECIISTIDFFTPIHSDAYTYGTIAAANALSDVYAMGGKPLFATAILAWPTEKIPETEAAAVMQGAKDICNKAGITIAGGHSVMSAEPLFGLQVNGIAKQTSIKRNNTANEGDLIYITKPLGIGILTSAIKRKLITTADEALVVAAMQQLNTIGEVFGTLDYVTAMTDITGFGLAGHLLEMCDNKRLSAVIDWQALPFITDLQPYLKLQIRPDASTRNWQSYGTEIGFEKGINVMEAFTILPDPQTSGGLCVAVKPEAKGEFLEICEVNNLIISEKPIGKFMEKNEDGKTARVV